MRTFFASGADDILKEDVVQEGYTYSGKDISYTTIEGLFRGNVFTSYDYDLAVFGGLRLHALEIDSKTGAKYFGGG